MKNKKYFIAILLFFILPVCFIFADTPKIKMIYPQGGETFIKDKIYNITWDYSGELRGNVLINLISTDANFKQQCYLGAAPIQTKKYFLDINNTINCKNLLKDKGSYIISIHYMGYYAPSASYLDLIDKSNLITVRFSVDDSCGTANGKSFSNIPSVNLCNYGDLSSEVSIYDENNYKDGNWHWSCNNIKCFAFDSNFEVKSKFKATEIAALIGDIKNPEFLEYWTEGYCFGFNVLDGYDLVSCEEKKINDNNNYAGAKDAHMINVKIKKSIVCSQNYFPVCGKNKKTYPNDCFARKEGVEIDYSGVCVLEINGICGSSNGKFFKQAPSINLCQSGTASEVSKYSPWTWSCGGMNGGEIAQCSANEEKSKPVAINIEKKSLNEMSRAELLNYLIKLLMALQANKE
jgi:hypothetical protein